MIGQITQRFQSRLLYQLLIPILLLVAVPTILIGYLLGSELYQTELAALNEAEELEVNTLQVDTNFFLNAIDDDIEFLANTPTTRNLANSLINDDAALRDIAITSATEEFLAFANAREIYGQVRFLDATGLEVVRVDVDAVTGETLVREGTPKGDRAYFTETVKLQEGDIYVSPMNLNREGTPPQIQVIGDVPDDGQVTFDQLVPVVRYGTPIYTENAETGRQELAGTVVLNVYVQNLFDLFETEHDDEQVYLVNSDGYYLYNSRNPEYTFAFEPDIAELGRPQGEAYTIQALLPEGVGDFILDANFNAIEDTTYSADNSDFLLHAVQVKPPNAERGYFWSVGISRSTDAILAPAQRRIATLAIQLALIVIIAGVVVFYTVQRVTQPIADIGEKATRIASGDYSVATNTVSGNRRDEVGQLDEAFNEMASQVRDAVTNLESRVQARTADLETSAEIANAANQITQIEDLLSLTANLIRDRFDFYYTQVYLINDARTHAVLAEGTGYVGRRLLSRNHQLPLDGQSLVATAINTRASILVQDTASDERWLPNELLPDTRSEVVIPLRARNEIIGVLDIQHDEPDTFDDSNLSLFETLAEQLAVTFENVNLLENTETRAQQLATVSQVSVEAATVLDVKDMLRNASKLTKENFGLYHAHVYLLSNDGRRLNLVAGAGEAGLEMVANKHRIAMNKENSIVARAARTRQPVIANDIAAEPDFLPNPLLPDTKSELALPMIVGDDLVGVMDVQAEEIGYFDDDDGQVLGILASQLAVAVKNAQLFQNVNDIRFAIDAHSIVATTDQTGIITYANDKFSEISKFSNEELIGQDHRIINSGYHSKEFIKDLWVTIANGETWKGQIKNKAKDGSYYWVDTTIVPFLNDEGKPYQYIAIRSDITAQKEQEEILERRARELEAVANVSTEMSGYLDVDELLTTVANLTKQDFGHYHAHIYLLSDDGQYLNLAAGAGEVGQAMVEANHRIKIDATSIVAESAREREPVVITNVKQDENFLPNPLLPETQSEMAVPIIYRNQLLGVLDVQDNKPDQFSDAEVQVKQTLANQIAVAIENARAFQRVTAQQEEIDRIFNTSIDMLGSADFEGYFTRLNDSWSQTLGWSEEELKAEPFISFVHPDDVEATNAESAKLAEGAKAISFENRYRTKDGSYRWLSWNSAPDFDNGLIHFVARDVTELKAQQEEIERRASELETVARVSAATTTILNVEDLLDAVVNLTKASFNLYHAHIYLLDEEGDRLVLAAGAGDAGQIMKEQQHAISMSKLDSVVVQAAVEREGVIVNDTYEGEFFLPNPLLPETRSELAVPLVVGDELLGVLDVQSERVGRFNEDDVTMKTTLADQVAVAVRNAQAFERERRTVERLREVDRLKQEFLANMSHELRTPLNSIIGYSEVLLDGVDGELTDDAVEDVDAIYTSGKHLLSIINEILDLAKIEAGQMTLQKKPFDLAKVIADNVRSNQILVKDKPVEILLEEEDEIPMVMGDPIRINQVMINIVGNAIKFTEEGHIKLSYGMYSPTHVYVRIEDTGMGMSDEQLEVIFQRFRQVDGSSTRRAGGTGLGLTITKQLIEMQGGSIGVDSEVGVGSTFWFTLPIAAAIEPDASKNGHSEVAEPTAGD